MKDKLKLVLITEEYERYDKEMIELKVALDGVMP